MRPTMVLSLCLLVGVASTARAQVTLQQKYLDGTKSTVVVKIDTQQTLKITVGGQVRDMETGSKQTRTIEFVNGKRAADGTIRVQQKITGLQASLVMPGGVELEFDSKQPDAPPPGTQYDMFLEILKATSDASWTMVHDKTNRVVAVEGGKEALEALDEGIRGLVAKQFDEEYMKEQANNQVDLLPATPVAAGDTWERSSDVRLEAGQHLEFNTQYEYQGTVKNATGQEFDKITVRVLDVDYVVDDDSLLKISESDLTVTESGGTILFDRKLGGIVTQENSVRIGGTITFLGPAGEIPGELDLTMKTEMKRQ